MNDDMLMPQSLEAEMSCLGSMMLSADAIDDVVQIIPPTKAHWFYGANHASLYVMLVDMRDRGMAIDLLTVRNELDRLGNLERVGGTEYIVACAESVPTHVNAKHYADIIRDHGVRRDLIACAGRIAKPALDMHITSIDALEAAEREIQALSGGVRSEAVVNAGDEARTIIRALDDPDACERVIPTGFPLLDQSLGDGLRGGELVLIAARPSVGKSALGLAVATNIAMGGDRVLFYSMEMKSSDQAKRVIARMAKVELWKVRKKHAIRDYERERIDQCAKDFIGLPLDIDPTPAITLSHLRSQTRRQHHRRNLSCVVIDYLGLMTPAKSKAAKTREREVAEFSAGCKALAMELDIPVIALSQLNRDPAKNNRRPALSDLRDSGSLEQDADIVLFLHNDEKVADHRTLIIAKQRNGALRDTVLKWNGAMMDFVEIEKPQNVVDDATYAKQAATEEMPWA